MGNTRNRKRKAVRTPPSKMAKKSKHGRQYDENPGPSGMKIGDQTAKIDVSSDQIDTVREGMIFMDLFLLFGVFNEILRCPECDGNMDSHVDMRKKNGYSNCIVLQCKNQDCEWKHSFNTSKKQGRSHEVNVRAVLAF